MIRSNAPVPFLNPFTERSTRENENRKLVIALQRAKPLIDNSSPLACPHLQDNKKREWIADSKRKKGCCCRWDFTTQKYTPFLEQGYASGFCGVAVKYAKIERENALLLERLCLIARPRSQFVKPKTFT